MTPVFHILRPSARSLIWSVSHVRVLPPESDRDHEADAPEHPEPYMLVSLVITVSGWVIGPILGYVS
jgi:hypothetical protein